MIGTGIVVNDWTALVGHDTTATEISVIDAVFKLQNQGKSIFAAENRGAFIDQIA